MPIKSIPIQLDKKRYLRFDTNAICMLEEELDISFFKIVELFGVSFDDIDIAKNIAKKETDALSPKVAIDMASRIKLKNLRVLLWVGLLHEDKELTLEQVGDLMDNIDSIVLIEKILEAYSAAIPVGKEVRKNPPGSKS